jgi:hypothetical protein
LKYDGFEHLLIKLLRKLNNQFQIHEVFLRFLPQFYRRFKLRYREALFQVGHYFQKSYIILQAKLDASHIVISP